MVKQGNTDAFYFAITFLSFCFYLKAWCIQLIHHIGSSVYSFYHNSKLFTQPKLLNLGEKSREFRKELFTGTAAAPLLWNRNMIRVQKMQTSYYTKYDNHNPHLFEWEIASVFHLIELANKYFFTSESTLTCIPWDSRDSVTDLHNYCLSGSAVWIWCK